MNSSPYIDPAHCRTCGECCKYFEVWYSKDNDPLVLSEIQRFQMLDGIGDKITIHEEEGGYWLRFNFPCKHLRQNSDTGLYSCAIYDSPDRPLLCRHFPYDNSTERDCPHMIGGDA
ncbi:Fe-S-cluster containining protein [Methanofollis sp. W23]|uniref:YkgJ family cysteine cluster protein n=1 Tax=Methanofollis sp. W23 TaxID=2817849 RepID=UPI001AE1CAA9|nr:YkgJ family cysteine cluster protein [Methanofollis sp. W23]MBP2147229.1 Fe-S-cluster containining protein [Methanofollis sp. W23]